MNDPTHTPETAVRSYSSFDGIDTMDIPRPAVPPGPRLGEGVLLSGSYNYRLERPLGGGGFGVVWLAQCLDSRPGRADGPPAEVALKFFRGMEGNESIEMLRRELAALLAIREARIPRVFDWGVSDGQPFYAMPYYPLGTLYERIESGRLSTEEAWRLLEDLLEAMHLAHRAGVLHLDIKPSNVMLDADGWYVLTDFGISQAIKAIAGTGRTTGLGSPGYQAPEQHVAEYENFDTRTDLYGVGATVWSAYTGINLAKFQRYYLKPPLKDPVLPKPSLVTFDVDPRLEEILLSLLRLELRDRPGGAAEALATVHRVRSGTVPAPQHRRLPDTAPEADDVLASLLDPMWTEIRSKGLLTNTMARFDDGEYLCRQGERAYLTFILLRGTVATERDGVWLNRENREGTFIGEVATLTGTARTASVRAQGPVYCSVFNAAELEGFLARRSDVSLRLVKLLAERLVKQSGSGIWSTPTPPPA